MNKSIEKYAVAMVNSLDHGVFILGEDLRIVWWNDYVQMGTGFNLEKKRGELFEDVFSEGNIKRFTEAISKVEESNGHVYEHLVGVKPVVSFSKFDTSQSALVHQGLHVYRFKAQEDGELFYCLMLVPIDALSAGNSGLISGIYDLMSEQHRQEALYKKLEQTSAQLLQSEKLAAIGQLAAGVAHEINNPIGYVFSNLKSLEGYAKDLLRIIDAIDTAQNLDEIKSLKRALEYDYIRNDVDAVISESSEGIDRVRKIINALKDFSHIDEEEFKSSDLHRGIETTLNVVNNELKYKAEVIREFGDLPDVECIPSQINQVVMNLLVNAAHAIEKFGKIIIRTGVEGQRVWIEVEDNGPGIQPEIIKRIFEPFFTTKPVGKGTGLGLSLSYNIIKKHNGTLDVQSEIGVGSKFKIALPIQQKGQGESDG